MTEEQKQDPEPEAKSFSVEEKLEILNAQLAFLIQAVAELDTQVQGMGNFLQMVFSLSAQRPEEEGLQGAALGDADFVLRPVLARPAWG